MTFFASLSGKRRLTLQLGAESVSTLVGRLQRLQATQPNSPLIALIQEILDSKGVRP